MSQFNSDEFVLLEINKLKVQEYDTIHLPGGTAKDGSFYAGSIVPQYNSERKEFYFLGVPYNSHFSRESGHNKKYDELPEQTAIRELLEETGLHTIPANLKLIWEKKIPDNRPGKLGEFHRKYFYLVTEFTGNIFTFEGPNPIDGETAAPIWIPASLFIKQIFGGHLDAIYAVIDDLRMKDRESAYALMNF